ncbi:MAG: glucuronoarabinoxylan endo-1,4-beta-xylanase, partial [Ruminococcus sp.]|nr:glucuronoarabinoxylan endo-1,4-beta-xylanase [Ruminococcus sp.]
ATTTTAAPAATTTTAAPAATTTTAAPAATTTTAKPANTTTTATPAATTTTQNPSGSGTVHYGDTNCDGQVRINDVVVLNRYLNDAKSITVSDQGKRNADCYNPKDGAELTAEDSKAIIQSIVHLVELPVNK